MLKLLSLLYAVSAAAPAFPSDPFGTRSAGPGWVYYRLGNQKDVTAATHFGILFEGGGTDVDAAYRWMCRKANGGDFLVLRATGTAQYDPYIARLCPGINSVSTLKIDSRIGAADPFVSSTIMKAEAIFIAGGNQADYVNLWQGTPVEAAVNSRAASLVPIGGTSAGNAVLAQFAFTAIVDTVMSSQALADPYNALITVNDGFLRLAPITRDTITDDHFVSRDRMGRLIAFLARIVEDGGVVKQVRGIAVDDNTAFLMEADGNGSVAGSSKVYFVSSPGKPEICRNKTPLTYRNVPVYRISAGGTFNLRSWTGTGGTPYLLSAVNGLLQSTQPKGAIY